MINGIPLKAIHARTIMVLATFLIPFIIYGQHTKDTIHFKRSIAAEHSLVLNDSALNALGIDSLLNKIEYVHNTLNTINNTLTIGYDTRDIQTYFPDIDSSIDIIAENLALYNKVLDVKNLQMFNVLLNDIRNQLSDWRNSIFKYDRELLSMKSEIAAFNKDSVLSGLLADSSFNHIYQSELADLKDDRDQAEKGTNKAINTINQLQADLSNEYFEATDLQNQVNNLLKKASAKSFGKEYDYLWQVKTGTLLKEGDSLARKSYRGQRRILRYYFKRNWDDQVWMLVVGLIFLLWIFRNFTRLEKYKKGKEVSFNAVFIQKISILSTLTVLFNLAPLFDLHPPTAYVEIMELFLVISLTILLWKRWAPLLFRCWVIMGMLYIVFSFTGILLSPGLGSRLLLLSLNILSVVFGIYWIRKIRKVEITFSGMIKFVSIIYIILNIAGIVCNVFGRLSLAKIFGVTAIFGLTQVIGLSAFIQIILEALRLQTTVNQLKGGLTARLNFDRIQLSMKRALMLLSVVIWLIVFSISLNIYNVLYSDVWIFLTKPRKIGSTTFEIGNILLFIVIIYISNILQKGIGSLYGRTEETWDPEVRKNGSRLAITRLILLIIGFMIAVAASGLPLDKITIVLGALGVGIGLGLQGIVNNLVSGIVLIFEQPFRIGDFIELGDKKGRVLDIGIRSSKLVMDEGAEIIMPNGDLLSGRVINWTLRNDFMRLEIALSVETGQPFEEIKQMVLDLLREQEDVVKDRTSDVLLTAITDKSMSINVLAWINDVHRAASIKSLLLDKIHERLVKKGLKIL